MSFPLNLTQNIHAVVVPKSPAHFVVIHGEMILLYPPKSRQSRRIDDFEHPCIPAFPRDVMCIPLRGVVQKLLQEIPEKSTIYNDEKRIIIHKTPSSTFESIIKDPTLTRIGFWRIAREKFPSSMGSIGPEGTRRQRHHGLR